MTSFKMLGCPVDNLQQGTVCTNNCRQGLPVGSLCQVSLRSIQSHYAQTGAGTKMHTGGLKTWKLWICCG